jgi:DNA-binding IclR family transcriptional regulator
MTTTTGKHSGNSNRASKPKSEYSIQTVSNALRLLEAFYQDVELGVSELSRRLSLHKNNVFRLLATLEERGYIEQCADTERYRLGVRCLELGHTFARSHTLVDCARPVLRDLAQSSGESVHLGTLEQFEVVHLDAATASRLVTTASRVGRRLPPHCTALGKVLLGCGGSAAREEYDRSIVRGSGLEQFTPATITDRDKLFEHLRAVANQGFAVDAEECEVGLSCVAAPIFDRSSRLVAALSLSGPAFRLSGDRLHREVVAGVTGAAGQLSQTLGYS